MPSVKIYKFQGISAYQRRAPYAPDCLQVTYSDLFRYAVSTGGVSGRKVSRRGRMFYRELIRFALEERVSKHGDSFFYRSEDYHLSETSLKSTVSFLIGMVSARVVSEKCCGVSLLLHLKDKRIKYETSCMGGYSGNNECHPDFIGIDYSGRPKVLIEAKGTETGRVPYGAVQHAWDDQLKNIDSVEYGGRPYDVVQDNIVKHVVCSGFSASPSGHMWELSDIDPQNAGSVKISFDIDRATYCYYEPIMSLFDGDDVRPDKDDSGHDLLVIEDEFGKIALRTSIWEAFSARGSVDKAEGFYKAVSQSFERESSPYHSGSFSSCGDGVSVYLR